jgi:murein DD-endopeptidase MepM/ murein hydrolase activator NlpD
MAARFNIVANAVVIAILLGAAWLFWHNISGGPVPTIERPADLSKPRAPRTEEALQPTAIAVGPSGLAVPVDGIRPSDLVDTFTQSRGGGARVHNAIDIMAPVGRAVVSVAPGRVEKLFFSDGGGGNTVYVRSKDGRWMFYYAHLDAYAPNLREGQWIERATPLGTVGVSGNANPAGPHLHMAINRMAPGERWWQGTPVNPYPLLAGHKGSG